LGQPGKDSVILSCTILIHTQNVTDRRTDRQDKCPNHG